MQEWLISASKCKNTKNIPCPTLADIDLSIRALAKLDLRRNGIFDSIKQQITGLCASKGIALQLD